MPHVNAHRFRDLAAISAGGMQGETIYLTPGEAEDFARAILAIVDSVRRVDFQQSANLTYSGPLPYEAGQAARNFKLERDPAKALIKARRVRGDKTSWRGFYRLTPESPWRIAGGNSGFHAYMAEGYALDGATVARGQACGKAGIAP